MDNPLRNDLDHILAHTSGLWSELRSQRILLTGGTGFIGRWLLESFLWANEHYELNAAISVLTRNPAAFEKEYPHLAENRAVTLLEGDMNSFAFPPGSYSYLIHAATETSHRIYDENPLSAFDLLVGGVRRVLDFAAQTKVRKMLFLSSGAVYGRQPQTLPAVTEDYCGAPLLSDIYSSYSEGKRVGELLCHLYSKEHNFEVKIARCFTAVGPSMPIDRHFAFGNFIRDSLQGGPVRINGDGTSLRSYLYVADLTIWLWTILFEGKSCRPYNVGSDTSLSIREVAAVVAENTVPGMEVIVARQPAADNLPEIYVPSIQRARFELKLEVYIDLPETVRRTFSWFRRESGP